MLHKVLVGTVISLLMCAGLHAKQPQTSIHAIALFKDKAMLSINGKKAKIVKQGQSYHAVKLLSSNTKQAEIEVDGKKQTLTLNGTAVLSNSLGNGVPEANKKVAQLWADERGFFTAAGAVNGKPVEFLVDTGANIVVLSSQQADRIGLPYSGGLKTYATTASGTAPMYLIGLDSISLKGIKLTDISAGIIEGNYPVTPLLGMTFLSHLEMQRKGNMMLLKKR